MSFQFLNLPLDNQLDVILNLDLKTIGEIGRANREISELCRYERVWREQFRMLSKLADSNKHSIPKELASTWKERMRVMWSIIHPKKVFTLYQIDPRIKSDIFSDSIYPHVVISNIKAVDWEDAAERITNLYNNHVEPLYSSILSFRKEMTRKYSKNKKAPNDDPYPMNKSLAQDMFCDFTAVEKDSTKDGVYFEFMYNSFIRFGNDNETNNLLQFNNGCPKIELTISGANEVQTRMFLALLLNYRHLFNCNKYDGIGYIIRNFLGRIAQMESYEKFKRPDVYDEGSIVRIIEKCDYILPSKLV